MMSLEREILVAVLKSTKNGPTSYSVVSQNARIPKETAKSALARLADTNLVTLTGPTLKASASQRLRIAFRALERGADLQRVCSQLEWKEFESIATAAFKSHRYRVIKNCRFKGIEGKRWEIDVLACKQPLIASVDCKRWRRNWTRAAIIRVVEQHLERSRAFADSLSHFQARIELDHWKHATVIPIILSLLPSRFKFHRHTPIVSVLQLQNFLNELPAQIDSLTHFDKKLDTISKEITEY
jgi:Holliday junction resolvase-like predicted endonuclease